MATMNSSQFRDVVEPIYNDIFDGLYEELETQWDKLYKVETALPRRFQEVPLLFGVGIAQEKRDGNPVFLDTGGEAYKVRFLHKTYALGFSLTEELMEDGDHIDLGGVMTEHMARGMLEAKEIVHVNGFNNAFNSSFLGGDGVTTMNSAHPLANGGTFSNQLTTPANLSEAALEQLFTQIKTAPNERQLIIGLKAVRLIVHPANIWNATRIVKSVLRSGTSDNDVNAIKLLGAFQEGPFELTRLTNAKAFFIQTDAPAGLIHKKRAPLKRQMEGDFITGSMRYKARERYSAAIVDPRALYGSQGV